MIQSCRIEGVSGASFSFNNDDTPLDVFDVQAETRMEERVRVTQHGLFPTKQYFGKMTIHMEGKLFGNSTADYMAKRLQLSQAVMPRPDKGNLEVGTIKIQFDGISDELQAVVNLDGKPILPLAALHPQGSDMAVSLVSTDPLFHSVTEYSVTTGTPGSSTGGFGFPFSFPFSFGGGSSSGSVNVYNLGNAPTFPVVQFNGPCINPSVILNGEDKLRFEGLQLLTGEFVVVDFFERTATTNTGGSAYSLIDPTSIWWLLDPGLSVVTFTAFSAFSPSVAIIRYHNSYLF